MEKKTLEKTQTEQPEADAKKERREKILAWIWLPLLILILLIGIWTGTAHMVYTGGETTETAEIHSLASVPDFIPEVPTVV